MCIVGKQFVYLDLKPCWHDNSTDKALLDDTISALFLLSRYEYLCEQNSISAPTNL